MTARQANDCSKIIQTNTVKEDKQPLKTAGDLLIASKVILKYNKDLRSSGSNNRSSSMSHVFEKPPSSKRPLANTVSRLIGYLPAVVKRWFQGIEQRRRDRQAKREQLLQLRRQKIEERKRNSWSGKLRERLFVVLDYDPTDIYSGDVAVPTLRGAIAQSFYRVFWTRRIELTGFVLLCVIGWYCYVAVSQSSPTRQDVNIGETKFSSTSNTSSTFPSAAD